MMGVGVCVDMCTMVIFLMIIEIGDLRILKPVRG